MTAVPKEFPTHIVAASGIVANDRNEVLLVKNHRDEWGWTGGQVEVGENLIESAIREIREESGVTARIDRLVAISSNTGENSGYNGYESIPTKVMFDFAATYLGGDLLSDTAETFDARWVARDSAMSWITVPYLRARFSAYLDYNGSPRYLSYVTQPAFDLHVEREV